MEIVKQNYIENKKLYNEIEKSLKEKLPNVPIDHVGSTAIPNMYGKNIIDILVGVVDNKEFKIASDILESMGYITSTKSKTDIYCFFASTSEETKSGDIHIHVVIKDTDRYKEFILLRDYLLNNEDEVKRYSDFKRTLTNKQREEYKEIKSKYVTALINRAKGE